MKQLILFITLGLFIFTSCKENEQKQERRKFATTGDELIDKLTIEIDKNPLNSELRFQRAERLYSKSMYNECLEDLRIAMTTDSMQPAYYHLASDAFMDNALSNRALQCMQKAAALFPTRIPTLLKLSETYYILKQYDASILTLNEIIKMDPQNAEAYFMLGTTLKEMGQTDRAINAFQTATEFDSKLTDAWISLGNLMEAKNDKSAISFYQNAINIDPKNPRAMHALAFYYQNKNEIAKALQIYAEITSTNPTYVDAYLNSGLLYLEQNNLSKAYEQFNIMIGVDPKDWVGYHYRGVVNLANQKYKEAKADFVSSTNLNPENLEGKEKIKECDKYIN